VQNSFIDFVDIRQVECSAVKVHKILVIICTFVNAVFMQQS